MSIYDKLTEDMKAALKAGAKDRLSAIRLLRGQLRNASIDKQDDLTSEEEINILNSAAKKCRESIQAYENAGRNDLAEKEKKELNVIMSYLPEQLSDEEIVQSVDQVIQETGASGIKDIGKVMPVVMGKLKGRADGKKINQIVREKLG
jgi:hypothetical protein